MKTNKKEEATIPDRISTIDDFEKHYFPNYSNAISEYNKSRSHNVELTNSIEIIRKICNP